MQSEDMAGDAEEIGLLLFVARATLSDFLTGEGSLARWNARRVLGRSNRDEPEPRRDETSVLTRSGRWWVAGPIDRPGKALYFITTRSQQEKRDRDIDSNLIQITTELYTIRRYVKEKTYTDVFAYQH